MAGHYVDMNHSGAITALDFTNVNPPRDMQHSQFDCWGSFMHLEESPIQCE